MSAQSKTTRRVFMIQNAVASAAVLMAVDAQAQAMVSETDPQAAALGYVADTKKVNQAKFPKHAATQACSNCVAVPRRGRCRCWGLWHLPRKASVFKRLVLGLQQEGLIKTVKKKPRFPGAFFIRFALFL